MECQRKAGSAQPVGIWLGRSSGQSQEKRKPTVETGIQQSGEPGLCEVEIRLGRSPNIIITFKCEGSHS